MAIPDLATAEQQFQQLTQQPPSAGATSAAVPSTGPTVTNLDPLYARNPGAVQAGPAPTIQAPTLEPAAGATAGTAGSESAQAMAGSLRGYDATTQATPEGALSANRLTEITGQASPLMQRARAEGMLTAGARGLENSSIAAGTAMGAMVDRATPLAMQDAQSVLAQEMANQAATNRASEFTAGQQNTGILTAAQMANEAANLNAQLQTAVSQGNAQQENAIRTRLAELQTQTNLSQAEMQQQTNLTNAAASNQMQGDVLRANAELNRQYLAGTQAMDLASIQGRYSQLIAANSTAAQLYDSYFQSISATMANSSISPARVAQTVNIQQSMLEAGLRMVDSMNSLDLGAFELPGAGTSGGQLVPTTGGVPTSGGAGAPPPGAPPRPTPPSSVGGLGGAI